MQSYIWDNGEYHHSCIHDDIEGERIPEFLLKIWNAAHGTDVQEEYVERGSTRQWNIFYIICTGILVIGGMIGMLAYLLAGEQDSYSSKLWHIPEPYQSILETAIGLSGILYLKIEYRQASAKRNCLDCYEAIERLFYWYSIEPSEKIGSLSKEEFRGLIEEELRKQADISDKATGFKKEEPKQRFKGMHRAAREWGLCHENYATYFPVPTVLVSK